MLTHRNFVSDVDNLLRMFVLYPSDNFLLVLPLHHAYGFTANLLIPIAGGAEISFIENIKTIGENIRDVQPSVLIGVPLLLEKMYSRILSGLKKKRLAWILFNIGIRKPVIQGIRQKLGGKLRLVISGGAPCDPDLLHGYQQLGIPIIEGYGLTETAPVICLNTMEAPKPGTVGFPIPDIDLKIMDPNAEGIGEIAVKGPVVMNGYYNNPAATEEVFKDGYYLTGDMGRIDDEGYVHITGRKKSLIVNREGKNIYPEEVEHQILGSEYISEALAVGYRTDASKTGEAVGIIVVPDHTAIDEHIHHHKKQLSEQEIEDLVRREVKKQSAGIAEYKRPRRIQIRWEEFDKTSTGKIKRYLYSMTA